MSFIYTPASESLLLTVTWFCILVLMFLCLSPAGLWITWCPRCQSFRVIYCPSLVSLLLSTLSPTASLGCCHSIPSSSLMFPGLVVSFLLCYSISFFFSLSPPLSVSLLSPLPLLFSLLTLGAGADYSRFCQGSNRESYVMSRIETGSTCSRPSSQDIC